MIGSRLLDLSETLDQVLSEPRFAAPRESWWDRLLARVVAELVRLIGALIDAVGGPLIAALLALGILAAITILVAARLAGRRAALIEDRLELARLVRLGIDPEEYLRNAEQASAEGRFAQAIRLRFIGGVLRLARDGRIRYEPGLTTGAIAEQVDRPLFARLAAEFDAIAYGGADAGPEEDSASRRDWESLRQPA